MVEMGLGDSDGKVDVISFATQEEEFRDEKHMRRDDKYEEHRIEIYGKSLFLKSQAAVEEKQSYIYTQTS